MKNTIVKINPYKNGDQKAVNISISGGLNLPSADMIRSSLLKATEVYKQITLKVKDGDDLDLSFIQTLLALKIYSLKNNIMVKYDLDLTDRTLRLIDRTGLLKAINGLNSI